MSNLKVIILAAGMGSRLRPLTNDKPKCMIKLLDETLIQRQIKIFHSCNINDITIVTGYKSEVIDIPHVNYVKNENYEITNTNESLFCALEPSSEPVLVTYSDVVFEEKFVRQMLEITDGIRLAVNLNWKQYYENRFMHPMSEAENVLVENGRIIQIKRNISKSLHNDMAMYVLIFAIGISEWPQFARVTRAATLVEKNKEYILASRIIGLSNFLIMFKHILPNILRPVLVIATIGLALAIITESTLSFLGVGVPPTTPSLGTLIRFGNDFLFSGEWWITFFPAIFLVILALSINLLGDWMRDTLNPKLKTR